MASAQRIFISYRQGDSQSQANGLSEALRNRLPDAQVVMDVGPIPLGADFEEHIRGLIDQHDVVLILIGNKWLEPLPGTTQRPIDDPNDFVRLEVLSALSSRQLRVIPIVVEGARMPQASELPEAIARLARLNAFELSDSAWSADLESLAAHLKAADQSGAPAHMAPRPTAPPSSPPPPQWAPPMYYVHQQAPTSPVGSWVIVLPLVSFGTLAWVAPLWFTSKLNHDPERRRKMYIAGGVLGALALLALILIGASPADAEGSPTGAMSDVGGFLMLACMAMGTVIGVRMRKPSASLPGAAEELRRRDLRLQYRDLLRRDAALAASMRIGRPDVSRSYDDGGLVDFNSMPAEGLQRFAGLSRADAEEVVRARTEMGRLSSLSELEAFFSIGPDVVARVEEIAVFV